VNSIFESANILGTFPSNESPLSTTPQPDVHPKAVSAGAGAATLTASAGFAATVTHEQDNQEAGEPGVTAEPESNNRNSNFDYLFGGPARPRSDSEKAADLNSAFSTMKKSPVTNGEINSSNAEFPPIQELETADDSDDSSEAPMAFDDDFNTISPLRPPKNAGSEWSRNAEQTPATSSVPGFLQANRPPLESTPSAGSSLLGRGAQTSPAKYEESEPHKDPAHCPPESKDLFARREDPASPPPAAGGTRSLEAAASHVQSGDDREHDNKQILAEQGPPSAAQRHITSDDFDSAFANMNVQAAPVDDDEDDEDEVFPSSHNAPVDFDPTFDSPGQFKSTNTINPKSTSIYSSAANGQTPHHGSNHIGNAPSNLSATANNTAPAPPATPPANTSYDWDAMFAGLDSPAPAAADFSPAPPVAASSPSVTSKDAAALASATPSPSAPQPERPAFGRALTSGTEHDDPILKRLTAMGWSREESLAALEKFDYNIDKVRT
jgi:epidermal growth factor receptor substrate 15